MVVIPLDLSEWMGKRQLREWISDRIEAFNWENPELQERLRGKPDYEPKALLRSVVFAYATGVFAAEDIVRACSRDPEFRPIRPDGPHRTEEVSLFRKLNRSLIKEVLVEVTAQALKSQIIERDLIERLPSGLRRLVVENSVERLDLARHMDRVLEM